MVVEVFNQDTPFFRGSEIYARRLGYGVLFAHIRRTKRGYYNIYVEPFQGDVNEPHAYTKAFVQFLEREIKKDPCELVVVAQAVEAYSG